MISQAVLEETLRHFPQFAEGEMSIEPLEKGGSGRKYFRLSAPCAQSLILVTYTGEREENRHFCDIAGFLGEMDLRVPTIFRHDSDQGLIWVEDLGAIDLWHFRTDSWEVRRPLYRSALEQVAALHHRAHRAMNAAGAPTFQKAFDTELYLWEQDYFFTHCVSRHFGISLENGAASRERLHAIANELAAEPRVLVHRDFQSQNVMVREEAEGSVASLIDFQGMRPGLGAYDLASLLYDPYVELTPEERQLLEGDYLDALKAAGGEVPSQWEAHYRYCTLQRLMQALGAYGFLGHTQGKTAFLSHIPVALERLHAVASEIDGLEDLTHLLAELKNS